MRWSRNDVADRAVARGLSKNLALARPVARSVAEMVETETVSDAVTLTDGRSLESEVLDDFETAAARESHLVFKSPELAQFLFANIRPSREPDLAIGGPADPYMKRWYLVPRNRQGNVYLHHVLRPDDDRAFHNHPWASLSIMLSGRMLEHTEKGVREVLPGDVILRGPDCRHRLDEPAPDTWTLFLTGSVVQSWGFFCPKGFVPWRDFTDGPKGETVGAGCGEFA